MKFGELIRSTKPELVVTHRHDAWMEQNSNPVYSEEALAFGMRELAKQATPRDRRGSISASSLDSCRRRQSFTYLGMPELPPTPKVAAIFQNGTFMHVRWQMAGLTEGWLARGEVPVGQNDLMLSGTQDGILYDGSIFEGKSINTNGFSGIATFGAKEAHIMQVGTYMRVTGAEQASIVYEDKNTQDYREVIVHRTKDLDHMVEEVSGRIWELIGDKKLAEPLDKCMAGEGFQYKGCPFRDVCMGTKNWEHAEEQASAHRA